MKKKGIASALVGKESSNIINNLFMVQLDGGRCCCYCGYAWSSIGIAMAQQWCIQYRIAAKEKSSLHHSHFTSHPRAEQREIVARKNRVLNFPELKLNSALALILLFSTILQSSIHVLAYRHHSLRAVAGSQCYSELLPSILHTCSLFSRFIFIYTTFNARLIYER